MSKRNIWTVGLVGILAVALSVYVGSRLVGALGVGHHQRSVTRSLASWAEEYGSVRTWSEADRAIGMLEYVQGYYVPGPGYRSDPETEAALEAQRARTLATIAAALREFSGLDLGTDAARWRAWRDQLPHE